MTEPERLRRISVLSVEARYRYEERLGILCCFGTPTEAQHNIAMFEAMDFDLMIEESST